MTTRLDCGRLGQDCEFQVVPAPMPAEFAQLYDECARQWNELRLVRSFPACPCRRSLVAWHSRHPCSSWAPRPIQQDLELLCPPRAPQKTPGGKMIWSDFWGSHQRFFRVGRSLCLAVEPAS